MTFYLVELSAVWNVSVPSWKYPRNLESFRVISRLRQRFQDDGNVSRCYSTDRPRVTTPNEDRYLAVTAKRNRRSTASELSRQLSSPTGTTFSKADRVQTFRVDWSICS
ncbi:HTH_Tnp_Tc3_2 domain-containing protein [Trichonephila clavipes]|nr:HTH_Tnp_Tc3_2 domain-containing protein [Trichonephila clavipes]